MRVKNYFSAAIVLLTLSCGGAEGGGDVLPSDLTNIEVVFDTGTDTSVDSTGDVSSDVKPDVVTDVQDTADEGATELPPDVSPEITYDIEVEPTCQQCPYYGECIQDCPSGPSGQACQQDCLSQLCPEDQQDFQAFYNCLSANGCLLKTTDEFSACIDQYCLSAYFKCYSGDKYATCVDLNACLDACPDDDPNTTDVKENVECWQECFLDATYDANMDFEALRACGIKSCPVCEVKNPTPEQDIECNVCWNSAMFKQCANELKKCVLFGTKYTTCVALTDCLIACPDDNPSTTDVEEDRVCINQCYNDATFDATADRQALLDCAWAKCPICLKAEPTTEDEDACNECFNTAVFTDCADEYKKCATFGNQYATCLDLETCLEACPEDDPKTTQKEDVECWSACFDGATFDANKDFTLYYDCLEAQCPICAKSNPTPEEKNACSDCINSAVFTDCADEYKKCATFGNQYATCLDLETCLEACPEDDPKTTQKEDVECWSACFDGATFDANKDFTLYYDCLEAQCPICAKSNPTPDEEAACETCFWTAIDGGPCQELFMSCRPHGDNNCPSTWTCITGCEDFVCVDGCYDSATVHAQNLANAFAVCIGTVCTDPNTFDTCMEDAKTGACKSQWNACVADAP